MTSSLRTSSVSIMTKVRQGYVVMGGTNGALSYSFQPLAVVVLMKTSLSCLEKVPDEEEARQEE